MGRFNMWMANLMRGRYGMDQMNRTLSIVALILIAANLFLRMRIINWLAVVLLIYIYCRAFSRNINRRAAENQRYLQFAGSVRSKFGRGAGNPYGQTPRTKDNTHRFCAAPDVGKSFACPRVQAKSISAVLIVIRNSQKKYNIKKFCQSFCCKASRNSVR